MPEQVTISAPSRLHFGLFSVGNTDGQKFGGAGLMIDEPRTIVTAKKATRFSIHGPEEKSVSNSIRTWFDHFQLSLKQTLAIDRLEHIPAELQIETVPARHSGFGTGTQLAFAATTALMRLLEIPTPGPSELAAMVDRGKRSAIGSHGFFRGGFLVDRGKSDADPLALLDFKTNFPEHWPVVTVLLKQTAGLFGANESQAFKNLIPTPKTKRDKLIELVRKKVIPGVIEQNYDTFAEGVFELGKQSGMMFAEIQNGPYNGPDIELLVNRIRDFGVTATGQSSWGPCVFAITRNDDQACRLVRFLESEYGERCETNITQADNQGAKNITAQH